MVLSSYMTTTPKEGGALINRLVTVRAHFGQMKSRRHPSMKTSVVGAKSRMEILDLVQTESQLTAAKTALTALGRDGKTVMFVGGKQEIAGIVRKAAESIHAPYVASRWLGGTLTNFVEIKKRIDRLAELREKKATGQLAKQHTKLELIRLGREEKKLEERLTGIHELAKKPDALVIVDTNHERYAAKEARDLRIPVIAIMGSDCNMADANFPIVANDASRATVTLLLNELTTAFQEGTKVPA